MKETFKCECGSENFHESEQPCDEEGYCWHSTFVCDKCNEVYDSIFQSKEYDLINEKYKT